MKKVMILRGLPGSGKSTYVAAHYPESVVCSADDWFLKGGECRFNPSEIGQAHSACLGKFIQALSVWREVVIVDNTNVHIWEFANYIAIAEMLGYKVEIVEFRATTTKQLRRCVERNVHGVPSALISRMFGEFEFCRAGTVVDV